MKLHVRFQGGGGGGRGSGPTPPPLKNHKNIGFSSNTGPYPLKNRSCEASIQCWAFIGMQAERHLMAFRWWADDGPLKVELGSSLPSSTLKNVVKVGSPLTKLSGSAHELRPRQFNFNRAGSHALHACVDPKHFFRGGSERTEMPLKMDHHRPISETPLSIMAHH